MAGVSGQGNTYNLPNFRGVLYLVSPKSTPFFSTIGGLDTQKKTTDSPVFEWQEYDLRSPGQNVALEGALAPAPNNRVRRNVSNVTEIHHSTIEISWRKLAATGIYNGNNINGSNPVLNELAFQLKAELISMVRDIEWSFINGTYAKPANPTTSPYKTRGIREAITTNVITNGSPTDLSADMIDDLVQAAFDNGSDSQLCTLLVPSSQKRAVTKAYGTGGYITNNLRIGGQTIDTIITDFGEIGVQTIRNMPQNEVLLVNYDEVRPVYLDTPGVESFQPRLLAEEGSSSRYQIYGDVGLEYGSETLHGKITNLN